MPRNKAMSLTTRAWQSRTLDTEKRTMTVVAATETPARVMDWARGEFVDEILLASGFKAAGKQIPFLDSHNRDSISDIIGSASTFRADGESVLADVAFSSTEGGEKAMQLYREGHLTDVSVGYTLDDVIEVESGKKKSLGGREFIGPVRVVKRWTIMELSAVAIGADPKAKARADDITVGEVATVPAVQARADQNKQEDRTMENTNPAPAPVTAPTPPIDTRAVKDAAIAEERKRVSEIKARAEILGLAEMADAMVSAGLTVEEAKDKLIEEAGKRAKDNDVKTRVEGGPTDGEKFRAAVTDAMIMRHVRGARIEKPAAGAQEMRFVSFRGLASEILRRAGVNTSFMSAEDILATAMGRRGGIIPQGTGDFAHILANVATKAQLIGFTNARSTYQLWCRLGSLPDFKTAKRACLGDAPSLLEVPQNGEVKFGAIGNVGENIALATLARRVGLSRQALVNDDMGEFDRIFTAFGARATDTVNALPYAVLAANAALGNDSVALFHTVTHKNLAAAGSNPGTTSVSVGEAAMMEQVAPNGLKLNVMPRYLLCGTANKMNAYIVLTSSGLPQATFSSGTANPLNYMVPIVDANISGNAWYLAADQTMHDTMEVAGLNGPPAPQLEERVSSDILGTEYWCYIDAVAKALSFHGLYSNTGA